MSLSSQSIEDYSFKANHNMSFTNFFHSNPCSKIENDKIVSLKDSESDNCTFANLLTVKIRCLSSQRVKFLLLVYMNIVSVYSLIYPPLFSNV